MKFGVFLLALATLFLGLVVSETPEEFLLRHQQARTEDGRAPLYGTEHDSRFTDEYIVMFQEGYTLQQHFESIGMDLSNATRFKSFSDGYRAKLDDILLDSHVRLDPGVLLVESNGPAELIQPLESNTNDSMDAEMQKRYPLEVLQTQAPYGLRMLSGPGKLSTPVEDDGKYHFHKTAGRGVNVYVFDTGIRTSHILFGGRATIFQGAWPWDKSKYTDETNEDWDGHGTHIAGTIGAKNYGVAPFANLISVKVLGEGGDLRLVAQALEDVIAEHRANEERDHSGSPWTFRGSIINMSMKSRTNCQAIHKQVINAVRAGITIFAAAGNDNEDVTRIPYYPCSYPETVCIGAVDNNYAFDNSYSNYGSDVAYLAPGTNILSLGIKNDRDVRYKSGTSQACPHAAGAAAIFVSWQGLLNNQAPDFVRWNSLNGLVSGVPSGTGTRLINTGIQSPKKWWNEPFRWGGAYPATNHKVHLIDKELNVLVTSTELSSVASLTPLSDVDIASYTTMETFTVSEVTGLTTEAKGTGTWDPDPVIPGPTSSISVPTNTVMPMPPAGGVPGQQIALLSDMNPDVDMDAWNRLIGYDSNKVSVLIANIHSGDVWSVNHNWQQVINAANSSGKRIMGVVSTGCLGASLLTTRLGSNDLADWTAQIESDIDALYRLYGSGLGGIFFDGACKDCGPDNTYSDLYAYINVYTKRRYPGAFTVLNTAGSLNTSQCLENTMDTLLTFMGSYDTYMSSYNALDWTPADPRKIWHIIHSVPADEVSTVVALAEQRGAGLVEVTDDTPDTPYKTLPDDSYMQSFMNAVQGGSAPVADAPDEAVGYAVEAPAALAITSYGYCSVSLSWNYSANAVGYNVYFDGTQVTSLLSYMKYVTIGDIPPGYSNLSISVKAIGGGNTESVSSESVIANTLALPGGRPIINLQADPQDGFTIYSADVLVPYSSLAVFITYSDPSGTCDYQNAPAWPIYYNASSCYCAVAVVQDKFLYWYNGTITDPNDAPFTWTLAGSVVITRDEYTYSWVAPIGLSTMDTTSFVIQARGHGPNVSVFSPCPEAGERPDHGVFCG